MCRNTHTILMPKKKKIRMTKTGKPAGEHFVVVHMLQLISITLNVISSFSLQIVNKWYGWLVSKSISSSSKLYVLLRYLGNLGIFPLSSLLYMILSGKRGIEGKKCS